MIADAIAPCPICGKPPRAERNYGFPQPRTSISCDGADAADHLIQLTGADDTEAAGRWNRFVQRRGE